MAHRRFSWLLGAFVIAGIGSCSPRGGAQATGPAPHASTVSGVSGSDGTPASLASRKPAPFFFALSVRDVEESADWYESVLGFRRQRRIDLPERNLRIRLLATDDGFLELVEFADARSLEDAAPSIGKRAYLHGVFKVGFRVDDLAATLARLEALEVALRGKVVEESNGTMRSAQVLDPDGNVVQLFEVLRPFGLAPAVE